MIYTLHNATFNATEEAIGAFTCFDPARPEATDTGPSGMVEEMKAFVRVTQGMECLVDIGALFGIFSLVFTQNPGSKAYAIEASHLAYPILVEQCGLNPDRNITPIQAFAGEVSGPPVQCAVEWKHVIGNGIGNDAVTLPQTAIDDMGIERCDVMKIDVEAFECQVLRGAQQLIAYCRPVIFLEAHCGNLADNGETPESLMALIRSYGYATENLNGTPLESLDGISMTRMICRPRLQ